MRPREHTAEPAFPLEALEVNKSQIKSFLSPFDCESSLGFQMICPHAFTSCLQNNRIISKTNNMHPLICVTRFVLEKESVGVFCYFSLICSVDL